MRSPKQTQSILSTGAQGLAYRERDADCQFVALQHKNEERSDRNKHRRTRPEQLEQD
jgi:hypothetical protein